MRRAVLLAALAAFPSLARADDAATLATAWRTLHPGQRDPQVCFNNPDPVRRLVEDLDSAPGVETALASLRYGLVLIAADGRPLASRELGCGEHPDYPVDRQPQVLELSSLRATGRAPNDLVMRVRHTGHAGTIVEWAILLRREALLEPALALDESVDTTIRTSRRITISAPGVVEVRSEVVEQYRLTPSGKFVLTGSGADSRTR